MARLLFKLTLVPDDEAQEIRELLDAANIRYYETDAGFWRVGLDAIWLASRDQEDEARALILEYQQKRALQQKQNYAQLIAAGENISLWQSFRLRPLRSLLAFIAVLFTLTLTLVPFLLLLRN